MRAKLAALGLAAGLVAALAPLSPASAQCSPPPVDTGKPCADDACDVYAALDGRLGDRLPNDVFQCTL
jgi:hypothetical protein